METHRYAELCINLTVKEKQQMPRSIAFLFSVLLCSAASVSFAEQPNVILVMTDDQGYGDLGCHGNPILKTPNLDRLHDEAIRFTDFHVSPFCTPTRAALLTGRYPGRTGAYRTSAGLTSLRPDETTLAETFALGGYATGIFGKWHLGDSHPSRPIDQGFQKAVWHRCGGVTQISDYWTNDYFDDTYLDGAEWKSYKGYCTDVWFREAMRFIGACQSDGQPFFVYLPTNAPHGPFLVADKYKAPYKNCGENAAFMGMIANFDENMGYLLDFLDDKGLAENTILIYMTDNGSAAGYRLSQEGATRHRVDAFPVKGSYSAGMRGKKSSPYDGGHRVPFFLRWPKGELGEPRDIDVLAAHLDVAPTLFELCGAERSKDALPLDGRSLVPLLRGAPQVNCTERTLVTQIHGGASYTHPDDPLVGSAVMTERWRLVHGVELFDIVNDPGQRRNVAEAHPDVVRQLLDFHRSWYTGVKPTMKPTRIVLGSDAENPMDLTSQEWYLGKSGNPPWSHAHAVRRLISNAPWRVRVDRAGVYRFTLSRWPRCANQADRTRKYAIDSTAARIRIAGIELSMTIDKPGAVNEISFEIAVPAGDTELQTWLTTLDGKTHGAYFVTVERLADVAEVDGIR